MCNTLIYVRASTDTIFFTTNAEDDNQDTKKQSNAEAAQQIVQFVLNITYF